MNTPGRQRSTRDRPAKTPLSEQAVVDAALAILKAEGLDAVSMRRVASVLDTGAASLYVYVAGREGLLQAMFDRVIATVELTPPDPARWREQLHSLLARLHQALVAHPGIAATTLADPPPTEPVLLLSENLFGLLAAGGLHPQEAAWTCDILTMLVTASAIEEDELRAHDRSDRRERVEALHQTFADLPSDRFPMLVAHAEQMVSGSPDERFHFAIDVVVDGVIARRRPAPTAS